MDPFLERTAEDHFWTCCPKQIGLYESSNDQKTLSVDQVKKYFPMYGLALSVETDTTESEPSTSTAAPGPSVPSCIDWCYRKKSFSLKLDTSAETGRVVNEADEDSSVFKR